MKKNILSRKSAAVITIVALTLFLQFIFVSAKDFPRGIHLSWQSDPATTMTVMWRSEPGAEGSVEYGIESEYAHSIESESYNYKFGRTEVCWHTAEITGLEANTIYHYRVKTSEPWESEDHTFKTALAKGDDKPFKFVTFCDVQGGYENFEKAIELIKKENPDLLLYLGDFTTSETQMDYDRWFECGEDIFAEVPLLAVRGNVDKDPIYLDQFVFPGNERWYSLDYGNVHFVFLSTMTEAEAAEQRPWLLGDLRTNTNSWAITMGHKPVFGSGAQNGPELYLVDNWADIFEDYGIDLYLNGHEHSYERTWPIKEGKIDREGVIYITNGSVGNEFYPAVETWLTAKAEGVLCYTVFDVEGSQIRGTVKQLENEKIVDEFDLEHPYF
jgi:predicted phosphodiesterase